MRLNIFRNSDIPQKYHSNFNHLYLDIAWFGVLSGTAVNFLNVYATRLGASGLQIGLLTATTAIVNLFLAIPAGQWISKRETNHAVFWSSVTFRIGYLFWIPLPWFLNNQAQVLALIVLTFIMAIPYTPLGVGFNALFAEAVPIQYRARVAGTRNITFAIAYMLTSLIAGYLLKAFEFPIGYQIVFGIGAIGAAMSSYHLFHIKPIEGDSTPVLPSPQPDLQQKTPVRHGFFSSLRLDIWNTHFRKVLTALFFLHFCHYLASPIYPLYFVRVLDLNDSNIGIGTALYYLTVLIASTQLGRIVHRFGHKKVTGWGMASMSFYPIMLALSHNLIHFYTLSFINGFLFAMVNGAYANYMLENIPPNDRPSHLAWYTIIFNLALLGSSVVGPLLADFIGLGRALILFGLLRIVAGFNLLKWG